MQYYLFKEACATKETGPVYPQIQKWKPGYDDNKADSYYSYYEASSKGNIFPNFTPDMDALIMHGRAKPTDLLSSGLSIGFIVSQKLKVLFEQFKFPPHRFYPAKLIYKETEVAGYYFMHLISNYFEDYLNYINYSQSIFTITGIDGKSIQSISLESKQEYLATSKQLQEEALTKKIFSSISAHNICFNPNFDKDLDCFSAPFGIEYYISERLRNMLLENLITGCDITPTDKLLFNQAYI